VDAVVEAAKELFWQRGYQGSTLADLETATGLNRSSLYQAFGTKEELFVRALDAYIDSFIAPRLAAMERAGAGLRDVTAFFAELASTFRSDPVVGGRGCLWINSLAEFAGRPLAIDSRAVEYRVRMQSAFANALSQSAGPGPATTTVEQRSGLLTAATFGIWLICRIDPLEAALRCDAVIAEVASWADLAT
jgi:AcrR family transcriptional regulator